MLWTAKERISDTTLGYPSLVTKDFAASMQASVPLDGVVGVITRNRQIPLVYIKREQTVLQ